MAKRTPVTAKSKAKGRSSKTKPKAKTRLLKDIRKEYRQRMSKAGVTNVATVADGKNTVPRWISTQSLALDALLGGGYPCGKVVEITGIPHSGKSTLLDHGHAQVQSLGGVAVLADTETSRDPKYTASIGVNVKEVEYLEWDDSEQHIENVVNAIFETVRFWREKSPETPVLIGWDALGSTASQDDLAKGLGSRPKGSEDKKRSAKPGSAAKAMRLAMRQISPAIAGSNIALVILNHEYESIQMSRGAGPKRKPYGGQGLTHAASIRINLWPSGQIKNSTGQVLGSEVTAYCGKDRIGGHTNRSATFAVLAGVGVDNTYSVFKDLSDAGIIVKSGSWSAINLDGEVLNFQGWAGLVAKCGADDTLFPRLVSVYQGVLTPKEA